MNKITISPNSMQNMHYDASALLHNYIGTQNAKLKETQDYKTVVALLTRLLEAGIIGIGQGYCISMCDMIYTLLLQQNIKCRLVECQVAITQPQSGHIELIGFDLAQTKNAINEILTHVVLVTDTEIPMIIDPSISHKLPPEVQVIVDAVNGTENRVIASIKHPTVSLVYQEKEKLQLPILHQKSIVDRIQTDQAIFKNITFLKYALLILFIVSSSNALRGFYDYYTTFVAHGYWGPHAIESLSNDVRDLKETVNEHNTYFHKNSK
jgi:hypothetical protein